MTTPVPTNDLIAPTSKPNGVILLFGSAHAGLVPLFQERFAAAGVLLLGVVIEARGLAESRRILERRVRRLSPFRVLGQMMYRALRPRSRESGKNPDVPPPGYGWERESERLGGLRKDPPMLRVASVSNPAIREFISSCAGGGRVVVGVYGTSILPTELLREVPGEVVNLHTGLTQYYRGVNSTFWALADGRPERIGVTVHRVSEGIDTGAVLAQQVLGADELYRWRSLAWLDRAVALAGERLLLDVLLRLGRGEAVERMDVAPKGRLATDPTWCEYRAVKRRFKLR